MASRVKAKAAFQAMSEMGIPQTKTKSILKRLLKLFDKSWDLIEAENYRLLADSIFEYEDAEAAKKEKKKKPASTTPTNTDQREALEEETRMQDEVERPLKRLRLKHQGQTTSSQGQPSPNAGTGALMIPKPEPEDFHGRGSQPISANPTARNKGKQPISPQKMGVKESVTSRGTQRDKRASQQLQIREPRVEQDAVLAGKNKQKHPNTMVLIMPKDEPFTDDVLLPEPLAVVLPGNLSSNSQERPNPGAQSNSGNLVDSRGDQLPVTSKSLDNDKDVSKNPLLTSEDNQLNESDVARIEPANIDIVASSQGEVKLCLTWIPCSNSRKFHEPNLEAVLKKLEDNCIRTYNVLNPEFSIMKIMTELCEGILECGTNADSVTQECANPQDSVNIASSSSNPQLPSNCEQMCLHSDTIVVDYHCTKSVINVTDTTTENLMVIQKPTQQLDLDDIKCLYDMSDITRGEEQVKVSLENSNSEPLPLFHYITQNVVSHNACVRFSLSQIGEHGCCTCDGECLSSSPPCNCAQGGESPYTSDQLIKEEFLEECISMVQNPQKHNIMYCEECPLEKLKNEDMLDPCKGHLKRNFIKECWMKCGCSKYCGNRVVQRGIRSNLQVFWTPEGKGWGLRALEDLPKGSFVCEYVGEILTCTELRERNMRRSSDNHSYSVVLDAEWASKALKEDEVLCLDATLYGNVSRFINHRCSDANLIGIPVEVEAPMHHYYHVALFTARKVDAFEELTWDYGVDFDDNEHDIKAFRCLCGSMFCRNMKRSSRSRSALTLQ